MATVYLVEHSELGTHFALKVIDLPSKMVRDRLKAEGQIQAQLVHPNIVRVFDTIEVDGCPGLVLEHVDGPALDEMLEAGGFTLEEADHLVQGILRGVRAAHQRQLVHRDLKPGNILLARTPEGLVPKITDFGLAKVGDTDRVSLSHTKTGQVMGTPAYMAPEQFKSAKDVDVRADVWALGVLLYELVTGRRPFTGEDLFELHDQVRLGVYPVPSTLVPQLPERMEAAIRSALTCELDQRCPDAATLLATWRGTEESSMTGAAFRGATLERARQIADHRPRTAPPKSTTTTAGRPWWVLGGAAAGFAFAVAGLGIAVVTGIAVWVGLGAGQVDEPAPEEPTHLEPATEVQVPTPQPVAEPVAAPEPAPPPPKPAVPGRVPTPPAAATGKVVIRGEADRVVLVSASGATFSPGTVPAGVYRLIATFGEVDDAKTISVVPGQTTEVICSPQFKTCRAR